MNHGPWQGSGFVNFTISGKTGFPSLAVRVAHRTWQAVEQRADLKFLFVKALARRRRVNEATQIGQVVVAQRVVHRVVQLAGGNPLPR